jgi:hypothetical protein
MPAMSLEQASLVAQVVSAVAILASLILVAVQIHGNTQALRSQSYFNGLSHGQRPFELVLADPALAKIVNAGYAAPERLKADDRERFHLHTFLLFNAWEYFSTSTATAPSQGSCSSAPTPTCAC